MLVEQLRCYALECGRETELPGEVVERDLLALIASPVQVAQDVAPMFDKAVSLAQALDYYWTGAEWLKNAAKAKPEAQQPLGEDQLEAAYREIWRNKPAHFGFTTSDWITAGIRYAERAHGIGASGEASNG